MNNSNPTKQKTDSATANISARPVQRRLLIPLLIVLLIMITGFVLAVQYSQKQSLDRSSQQILEGASRELQRGLNEQADALKALEDVLLRDDNLKYMLKDQDREKLLEYYGKTFTQLQALYGVTHFYFQTPDRVNLLRLHKPEKSGDLITRFTTVEAERTGKPVSGIELGKLGTFTLRVVTPVYYRGTMIGYLELGKEIEDLLADISNEYDIDLTAVIRKNALDRKNWESGMAMLGRNTDWDRFADDVIIYSSGQLNDEAGRFIGEANHMHGHLGNEVNFDEKSWRVMVTPLFDVSGTEVGDLIFLYDTTAAVAASSRLIVLVAGAAILLVAALWGFLYVLLRRTDRGIILQQARLQQREAKISSILGTVPGWILNVQRDGTITYINREVPGYTVEELIGTNTFDHIPEKDHQAFRKAFDEVFETGNVVELETGIVPAGSSVTIWTLNNIGPMIEDGKVVGITISSTDISQRLEIEKAVEETNQNLQGIFDASSEVAIVAADPQGRITVFNSGAERLTGYTAEEMIGKQTPGIFHLESEVIARGKELTEELGRPIEGFEVFSTKPALEGSEQREWTYVQKNGSHIIVSLTVTRILDHGGNIIGFLGISLDVTAQRHAKEQLQHERDFSTNIINNTSSIICNISKDGICTFINPAGEQITGYSKQELVGKNWWKTFYPGEEYEQVEKLFKKFDGGEVQDYEMTLTRKDGAKRTIAWNSNNRSDENGNITEVVGFGHDATQRKQAELEVENTNQQLQSVLNASSEVSIIATDKNGLITLFNSGAEKMLGYSADEMTNKQSPAILHLESEVLARGKELSEELGHPIEGFETFVAKAKIEGSEQREWTYVRKDGTFLTVNLCVTAIYDKDGNVAGLLGVGLDVTERRKAEEAILEGDKQFMHTFYNSMDATLLIDDGVFTDCNEKTVEMLRAKNKEQVLMTHPSELSPETQPDGRSSFDKAGEMIAAAYENGSNRFEWAHQRLDGEIFPVEVSLMPVSLFGKQQLYCMWKDITLQKQVEENRKRAEVKFRSLYDSSRDAVMLLNEKGFFDCNEATVQMFGCKDQEDFCGKHPGELSPEFQPCGTGSMTLANERIGKAMQEGSNRFEWVHKKIDGTEFPAEVLLSIMELDGKKVVQATVRDITDRKQDEEKLKTTLAEVERFNKLMITREGRVIEMKKEVNALLAELGKEPEYESVLEK